MAGLPFLGVVAGAILQYIFTNIREQKNQKQKLKTQAYVDFLKGVSGQMLDNPEQSKLEYRTLLADAKMRISIYGSSKVIKSIADLTRSGAVLDTPERQRLFIQICQTMREESNKEPIPFLDTSQIIFNRDIE